MIVLKCKLELASYIIKFPTSVQGVNRETITVIGCRPRPILVL